MVIFGRAEIVDSIRKQSIGPALCSSNIKIQNRSNRYYYHDKHILLRLVLTGTARLYDEAHTLVFRYVSTEQSLTSS